MKVIHKVIKNNFYALKWVWQVCKKSYQINTRQQMETTEARHQKDYVKEVVFQIKYAIKMRIIKIYSVLEDKLNVDRIIAKHPA